MQKVFLLVLMITLLASFSIAKQPERSLLSRRRLNDAFLLVVEAGKCDGKGQKPSWLPNTAACNIARNALPDPYRNSKYDEYTCTRTANLMAVFMRPVHHRFVERIGSKSTQVVVKMTDTVFV